MKQGIPGFSTRSETPTAVRVRYSFGPFLCLRTSRKLIIICRQLFVRIEVSGRLFSAESVNTSDGLMYGSKYSTEHYKLIWQT